MTAVRPLTAADRAGWEALWNGYLEFYRVELPPEVTEAAWRRLLDPGAGMHGLRAAGDAGEVDGIVHCFFHPVTWAIAHRRYLEDLFAKPAARRTGIGRRLVEAVYARRTRKSPTGLLAYGGRQRDCAAALRSREPFDGSREVVTSARPTPLLGVFAASPTARASPPREAEVPSPERLRLSGPPPPACARTTARFAATASEIRRSRPRVSRSFGRIPSIMAVSGNASNFGWRTVVRSSGASIFVPARRLAPAFSRRTQLEPRLIDLRLGVVVNPAVSDGALNAIRTSTPQFLYGAGLLAQRDDRFRIQDFEHRLNDPLERVASGEGRRPLVVFGSVGRQIDASDLFKGHACRVQRRLDDSLDIPALDHLLEAIVYVLERFPRVRGLRRLEFAEQGTFVFRGSSRITVAAARTRSERCSFRERIADRRTRRTLSRRLHSDVSAAISPGRSDRKRLRALSERAEVQRSAGGSSLAFDFSRRREDSFASFARRSR